MSMSQDGGRPQDNSSHPRETGAPSSPAGSRDSGSHGSGSDKGPVNLSYIGRLVAKVFLPTIVGKFSGDKE